MPTLVDVQWKNEKNKMAKFDFKKWITENKHGKNLYEQGTADFKEQNSGSGSTGGSTGSGSTGGSTGSGTTGGSTGSGTTGGNTGSGSTGGNTGSGTTGGNTGSGTTGGSTGSGTTGGPTPTGSNDSNPSTFQCAPNYTTGQTQANGNPLTPNQIFGMQKASQTPPGNYTTNMTNGFNQYGCQYLQNNFVKQYQKNQGLVGSFDGTSPYCSPNSPGGNSAAMQQSDNPKWQGLLQSRISWLLSFAPSGCDVTANLGTQNETFKMHESKSKKKITKNILKKIIREELKRSLTLNESVECDNWLAAGPPGNFKTPCCDILANPSMYGGIPKWCDQSWPVWGGGGQATGPGWQGCCKDDDTNVTGGEDVRGCFTPAQANPINLGMPCPGSVGIVNLHHEPCCTYEGGGSDDPCLDPTNPEQPNCWYCKSDDCQQTGTMPFMTNADAANAGFSLYLNQALCNSTEDNCGPRNPEPEECGCCCDYVTAQQAEQVDPLLPADGPILSPDRPEPVPVDGCKPGSPTVPAVWSATKEACICTDPSKPYLIPGSTQPCKGQETPPTRGISHTENSIYESKKLREEIQKELFGK